MTMLEMKPSLHSDQIKVSSAKHLKITQMSALNIKHPVYELQLRWCSVIFFILHQSELKVNNDNGNYIYSDDGINKME